MRLRRTTVIVRKPFVENIIIRGREKRMVNPIFDERELWRDSYFVPNAAGASTKFRMGPDTFCYIIHNIRPYIFF